MTLFAEGLALYINVNSLKTAIGNSSFDILYPLISLIYLFLLLIMYFFIIQLSDRNISRIPNVFMVSVFSLIIITVLIKLCSILMIINIF